MAANVNITKYKLHKQILFIIQSPSTNCQTSRYILNTNKYSLELFCYLKLHDLNMFSLKQNNIPAY